MNYNETPRDINKERTSMFAYPSYGLLWDNSFIL